MGRGSNDTLNPFGGPEPKENPFTPSLLYDVPEYKTLGR